MDAKIAEIVARYADNLTTVIAETRPGRTELEQMLETELNRLVFECAAVEVKAEWKPITLGEELARR